MTQIREQKDNAAGTLCLVLFKVTRTKVSLRWKIEVDESQNTWYR